MEYEKPPLGAKPGYIQAWQRIGELAEAIERQYEVAGNIDCVKVWAKEIALQCDILKMCEEHRND